MMPRRNVHVGNIRTASKIAEVSCTVQVGESFKDDASFVTLSSTWEVPPGGWTQILLYMGWCEVSRGPGSDIASGRPGWMLDVAG